ncbi:MAG TPA: acyltransferase [Stellaceae bacterium]
MRGIAALVVLGFHALHLSQATNGVGLSRGYLAVDFFFFLSGFVLAHVYGRSLDERPSRRQLVQFLWARVARIYPVHLCALALLLPFYNSSPEFSGRALLINLVLGQGPWLGYLNWNIPSWSISAEFYAYLLFPVVVHSLLRKRSVALPAGIAAALALAVIVIKHGNADISYGPLVLTRCLPEFLLGVITYRLFASGWAREVLRRDSTFLLMVAAIIAVSELHGTDAAIIGFFPFLILAGAHNEARTRHILGSTTLQYLGRISYSIYMVQMVPVMWLIHESQAVNALGWPVSLTMVVFFCIPTLWLGAAVSYCIEYPARAFLRSLGEGRRAASLPGTS